MPKRDQAPGKPTPINGGQGDGGMFFLADDKILVGGFDMATSQPMDIGDGVDRVLAFMTCIGKDAATGEAASVTLILQMDTLRAIPSAARKLFLGVPEHLRVVGGGPDGGNSSQVPGTVPEG